MKINKFLIGLGIGAVAGMLLAPKKGSELREDIVNKSKELSEAAKNFSKEDVTIKFNEALDRIQTAVNEFDGEKFKQATQDKLSKLSSQIEELKTKVVESEEFNTLVGTFNHIANTINDKVEDIIEEMEEEVEDLKEDFIEEEIDETAKEIEELISEMNSNTDVA